MESLSFGALIRAAVAWYLAHPVEATAALAAFVGMVRSVWRVAGPRLAAISPRWRSAVEGVAAFGPDVLRGVVKIVHALTGRDLGPLLLGPGADETAAQRIAALEQDNAALRRRAEDAERVAGAIGAGRP